MFAERGKTLREHAILSNQTFLEDIYNLCKAYHEHRQSHQSHISQVGLVTDSQ